MNKRLIKFVGLALSASLLSSCTLLSNIFNKKSSNSSGNSSSSTSKPSTSSSSSQNPSVKEWDAELKTLMQEYCGEVLPVPEVFAADYEFEIYNGYLYIDDYGSSFTIANYYERLEAAGWYSSLDEEGNHALIDSSTGDVFYECYKESALATYTIQYWFDDEYGNEICCDYEQKATEKTADTDWSDDDKASMISAFGYVLPFQKFGSDYYWEFDGLLGMLSDSYIEDLCTSYKSLLASNGFTLVESGSHEGEYQKTTIDGNTLYVAAEYSEGSGNAVLAELVPVVEAGWPTDELASITSPLGITVPAPSSGTFSWYVVNGAITATTATASEMVDGYCEVLTSWNLIVDDTSYAYYSYGLIDYVLAYPWEETVNIYFGDVYAEDGETVTSFFVTVELGTPSSEFSASWPGDEIAEFLGEGAPEVPSADKVSIKDFKYYETQSNDGTPVFVIQAYDDGTPGVDAIEDTYKAKFGAGWTLDSSQYDDYGYYETDSNNKVKVQFFSYEGFFSCYIYKLSGGSTPVDVGDEVTITPDDVPESYDSPATERTICGLTMMVYNVMKQDGKIQLKKNSVNMYNTTAYSPMASITFTGTNKQDDTFTVYAGNSSSSLEEVTPTVSGTTLTYNMGGATFFKIENGSGVFTCDSIVFGFAA